MVFLLIALSIAESASFDPLELSAAIKLGLSSVGLIGALMLYYRWMDAWLRLEVDENLRLRQLSIDVDRASWVVEMLSEVKSETDRQIPDEVLQALTRNMFMGRENTKGVTHPAEDMLAALLGSSKEIEVDLPNGRLTTNGKSLQKASSKVS